MKNLMLFDAYVPYAKLILV